jgi:hypothetical protein
MRLHLHTTVHLVHVVARTQLEVVVLQLAHGLSVKAGFDCLNSDCTLPSSCKLHMPVSTCPAPTSCRRLLLLVSP